MVEFYFCRHGRGGDLPMTLYFKAAILMMALSSVAVFLADWGWGP
jgi:hypothetical protein